MTEKQALRDALALIDTLFNEAANRRIPLVTVETMQRVMDWKRIASYD